MFLAINQNALGSRSGNSKKRKKDKENFQNEIITPKETDTASAATSKTTTMAMATTNTDDCNALLESRSAPPNTPPLAECKNCQHTLQNDRNFQRQRQLKHKQPPPPPAAPHDGAIPSGRVPCQCDCDCVNKNIFSCAMAPDWHSRRKSSDVSVPVSVSVPAPPAPSSSTEPPITSLCTVYICLGTLTLALGTLAVLFYSHVSSAPSSLSVTTLSSHHPRINTLWPSPSPSPSSSATFREQFQRELLASDHVLRSMVAEILMQRDQYQPEPHTKRQHGHSTDDSTTTTTTASYAMGNNVAYQSDSTDGTSTGNGNPTAGRTALSSDNTHDENDVPDDSGKELYNADDDVSEIVRNERKYTKSWSGAGADATKRLRRDISSSPSSMHADPFIEFFTPNHRKVLDEQDTEIRKRTGLKGAAPGGDEWVYLNTYCRVPEKMITGFCKGTQDYCPASPQGPVGPIGPKGVTGPPGLPGIPGPKGNRGDVGLPGPPGIDGGIGPLGPRGPKGDIGIPGRIGLDGRDGVPGEPGLDGVPGRAGADGIPGKDGMPGRDGRDGLNGKDGKDGAPGPKGSQGPPGERGLKGIAGPRGRAGKAGSDGIPGTPGVNTWKVKLLNGSYSNDLLIPPSIADLYAPHIQRTVIVEEGKTLNLSCAATGNPQPHVEWRRDDGRTINIHGVEMSSMSGQFLKFSNITRNQMAAYTCFADNGIAPVANATFLVEVHFSPMISVYRQMIYAEYGHSATLECLVEAFPEAIRYWERAYDGKILDPGEKYRIETYPDGFKTAMRLTISNLRKDDFGYYHCVARNELNATMVNFEIAPQDPNSETPYVGKEIRVYGQRPPESECPICEQCPDPSLYQCKDSINSNFEIQPTGNYSYPGLPKRPKSCFLYAVGKPVFHKAVNEIYGCWLKDPAARDIDREKTFVTNENDSYNLFEFSTKMQYRMNSVPRKKYEIKEGFHGNAHVVYNGSFYYNKLNSNEVVKLDLSRNSKKGLILPYAGVSAGNKLYSTNYNFMDFNVDEVGLWVIYSTYDSNNTLVAKLDAEEMKIQYNFNLTLDHKKFGEMFIVCGHLYAIDSCTDKNSQIRYVVDLYNGKLLNVDLPFSNPFRQTTTVGYNPYTVELYSWDKGSALTYPIRYKEHMLGTEHNP